MGDRVVMQIVKRDPVNGDEFGPILYSHWGGCAVHGMIRDFRLEMADRRGLVSDQSARLLGQMLKLGSRVAVWNAAGIADEGYTCGGRGVILIDADTFGCTLIDSDLQIGEDGIPFDPTDV